ncbi:WxL domain-containing protein [Enterococcus sp. LJL98]
MKKSTVVLMSAVLLGSLAFGSDVFAEISHDENGSKKTSNADVSFVPSTEPTDPVDPTDPEKPIDPTDPTDPIEPGTGGPLSIDFASHLHFGEQEISTSTKTYYANLQEFTYSDDPTNATQHGPNFVQVTDNRGDESGWTLSVSQPEQFKTESGKELTGAKIIFKNQNIGTVSESGRPTAHLEDGVFALTTGEKPIMSAKAGAGAGTYSLYWGQDATEAETSIELEVPGKTTKYKDTYKTTINWVMSNTPGA